jgi:glycosyltransferase involved in cell wall biosynthesis
MSPRFSIVTPVYDPPDDVLRAMIDSVLAQTFQDWELILVDDVSPSPQVWATLERAADSDPRIRPFRRESNGGIVAASNDGLEVAMGDFVVLLDHDDLLVFDALAVVEQALRADDTIDYLYSDEDKITPEGHLEQEFYKPDWSPERLRSQNYCCHLSVLRRSLVEEIGRFREGFDGSQDHDLILRITEKARTIHHVPTVLYHWRILPTSAAASSEAKPYAVEAGRRAVQEHCDRVGIDAVVENTQYPGNYCVRRRVKGDPLVSIIIPTCGSQGRVWGVERYYIVDAIRSIIATTEYRNLEFVVVADTTTPPIVIGALQELIGDRLNLVWFDKPFNFAEKMNVGRVHSSGDVLLLLNDDIEVVTPDFIEVLVAIAQEPDVGSVGAKLLYSDGTLQHAGHFYNTHAYHFYGHWSAEYHGPHAMLAINRDCIGVTAACMAIRPEVWDEVGGMTTDFPNSFNDVDLALKLHTSGYRTVWTPQAVLYHLESVSRDPAVSEEEGQLLVKRWQSLLVLDPYGNINLEPKLQEWIPRGAR